MVSGRQEIRVPKGATSALLYIYTLEWEVLAIDGADEAADADAGEAEIVLLVCMSDSNGLVEKNLLCNFVVGEATMSLQTWFWRRASRFHLQC